MNEIQIKTELIHRGYLTGWEILHYENLLKKISKKLKNEKNINNR